MTKSIPRAWLFDVDGVITDPQEKQIIHPQIIDVIIGKLLQKEPVGLVTGRSIDWLEERVLHHFTKKAKGHLSNFFISGEKGGAFGVYDDNNKLKIKIDKKLKVPDKVIQGIKKIIKENFSNIMFYDEPKKTMASVEVIDGKPLADFKRLQPKLDALILDILKRSKLEKTFRVDSVRISTDIEHVSAGKNLGARRFLDWLNDKNVRVSKFYAFGDSRSDVAMAQELHDDGQDVTFIFVGGKEFLKGKFPFQVIFPRSLFAQGAVEFLSQNP